MTATTVTMGARRHLGVIAIGSAFDEKNQQKQSKNKYGGCQYKNDFRH
jgi:hypothetical protein